MKPRLPTAEEKRQWRESNRFTKVKNEAEEVAEAEIPEVTPSASSARTIINKKEAARTSPKTSPPAPLKLLAPREANRTFKPHPIEATLDLHGLTKLEAHAQVETFIRRQSQMGRRHVAIITGKGRDGVGILRTHVPHWLNEAPLRPLVSALAHARPEKGGAGVLHVLLKKARE